jgi:hypothetical protein
LKNVEYSYYVPLVAFELAQNVQILLATLDLIHAAERVRGREHVGLFGLEAVAELWQVQDELRRVRQAGAMAALFAYRNLEGHRLELALKVALLLLLLWGLSLWEFEWRIRVLGQHKLA